MNFGKIIVHGHTPTVQPEIHPNRINIDTRAYDTGRLTCLVLEKEFQRFLCIHCVAIKRPDIDDVLASVAYSPELVPPRDRTKTLQLTKGFPPRPHRKFRFYGYQYTAHLFRAKRPYVVA